MLKINKKALCRNTVFCESLLSKTIGLRFKAKKSDTAYIFPFEISQRVLVDMWFVFFPIDLLFLDENKYIIEMKENFMPFSFYHSINRINYVVELEQGLISRFRIELGQRLEF